MITGMENTLKASIQSNIEAEVTATHGTVETPNAISEMAQGIADAVVPFMLTAQVLPGTFANAGGPVAGIGLLL